MILLAVGFLLLAAQTFGSVQAIITVSRDALSPDVIEVQVGELIRWQAQVASICTCASTRPRPRAGAVATNALE